MLESSDENFSFVGLNKIFPLPRLAQLCARHPLRQRRGLLDNCAFNQGQVFFDVVDFYLDLADAGFQNRRAIFQ